MPEALRPVSTGELLDQTFTLYKRNFLLFAAIAVPAPAIYLLFELVNASFGKVTITGDRVIPFSTGAVIGSMATIFLGLFVYLLGLSITHAATIRAVSAVHLARPIDAGGAYASLKGRYLRIIGVFISVAIRVFGGAILLYFAAVMVSVAAIAAAAALGTIATVIAAIVSIAAVVGSIILAISLYVRYSLAVQACVIEDIPIKQSLKRSVFLAKGSRNRILTVYALFLVVQLAVGFTLGMAAGAAVTPLHAVRVTHAAGAFAGFIAGVLVGPLATIAMSLVYYDERVRKEAFDLQLMMAALDGIPVGAATSATS